MEKLIRVVLVLTALICFIWSLYPFGGYSPAYSFFYFDYTSASGKIIKDSAWIPVVVYGVPTLLMTTIWFLRLLIASKITMMIKRLLELIKSFIKAI